MRYRRVKAASRIIQFCSFLDTHQHRTFFLSLPFVSFPITITITGESIAETTSMKPAWHISRQGEIHNSDASGEETAVVMNWCSEMDDVHCYCYVPYCSGKVHTNANSERRIKRSKSLQRKTLSIQLITLAAANRAERAKNAYEKNTSAACGM